MSILEISSTNNILYYDLPDFCLLEDIWEIIFSYLDSPKEVGALYLTNHYFKIFLSKDLNRLFQSLLNKHFPNCPVIEENPKQSKNVYQKLKMIRDRMTTGQCGLLMFSGYQDGVSCISVCGDQLITGSREGTIVIYELKNGEELRTLRGHQEEIRYLLTKGNELISASLGGIIKVWNLENGEELQTFGGSHIAVIKQLSLLQNGNLVSGSEDGTIRIWDLKTGEELQLFTGHTFNAKHCLVYKDKLISGSDDCTIKIWELNTGEELQEFSSQCNGVQQLSIDDNTLISLSGAGIITVWDLNDETKAKKLYRKANYSSFLTHDKELILGSEDGTIKILDLKTGKELRILEGHSERVINVLIYDDKLISASEDETIKIWDFKKGTILQTLQYSGCCVKCCAKCYLSFSDGKLFARADQTMNIWDFNSPLYPQETLQENSDVLDEMATSQESSADLQALGIIHVNFKQIEEKIPESLSQIFARGKAVKDALNVLAEAVEQKLIEAKSFDANSGWVGFREKLAKRFTSLTEKCQTPALLANLEEYREIVKETNELIDEFNQLDRSFQELNMK